MCFAAKNQPEKAYPCKGWSICLNIIALFSKMPNSLYRIRYKKSIA